MTKEFKTKEELKALLDDGIAPFALGDKSDPQFIRIVNADPKVEGANWKVAYSGGPGNLSKAIAKVFPELQKKYDLKED